jgi:hypothetical protein
MGEAMGLALRGEVASGTGTFASGIEKSRDRYLRKKEILLCIFLLCLISWVPVVAQHLEVSASRIPLPEGNVLGAVFYEDKGMFFVQQNVLSTENGGLVIRSHRQLSSWKIKNGSIITKRIFAESPPGASAYPCGRVELSAKLHRVFLCSAGTHVEVIDPDDLRTIGTIAQTQDQYISDFVVDDPHGRMLVLASGGDGVAHLTIYSLLNGDKREEVVLPATNVTKMSLAVAPRTGQIGIAIDVSSRSCK